MQDGENFNMTPYGQCILEESGPAEGMVYCDHPLMMRRDHPAEQAEVEAHPQSLGSRLGTQRRDDNERKGIHFSVEMDEKDQASLSETFITNTVAAFPVKPDAISNVRGPAVQVRPLMTKDSSTVLDVQVTQQFRAHFDGAPRASLRLEVEAAGLHIEDISSSSEGIPPQDRPHSHAQVDTPTETSLSLSRGSSQDSFTSVSSEAATFALAPLSPSLASANSHHRLPWEIDPTQVHVGPRIAVGGFGEVFVGKYQGTLVAVKVLLHVDGSSKDQFRHEIVTLISLRHPNLVLFMGYTTRPHLAIVSEYMQRGSLFKVLRKGGNVPLEPRLQRSVAVSVARGMAYLHALSPPLIHLDLKSPNILVDDRWRIKIGDFGLSRSRFTSALSGTGAGTPEWMAPEVLRSEKHDEKADVYSYGVVLWECLTGKLPWEGMHPMQVVGAVGFQGRSLPIPEEGDPFLISLCTKCMAVNPVDRPSFPEILEELEVQFAPAHFHRMSSTLSEDGIMGRRSTELLPALVEGANDGAAIAIPQLEAMPLGGRNNNENKNDRENNVGEFQGARLGGSLTHLSPFAQKAESEGAHSMALSSAFAGLAPFNDEDSDDEDEDEEKECRIDDARRIDGVAATGVHWHQVLVINDEEKKDPSSINLPQLSENILTSSTSTEFSANAESSRSRTPLGSVRSLRSTLEDVGHWESQHAQQTLVGGKLKDVYRTGEEDEKVALSMASAQL